MIYAVFWILKPGLIADDWIMIQIAAIPASVVPLAPTLVQCFPGQRPWSFYLNRAGHQMSKFGSARAVLAVSAVVALAGCSTSASSSAPVSSSTSSGSAASSVSATPAATPTTSSNAFVPASSISFPIAVGNTWLYQITAKINGAQSTETKKILSVVPVSGGRRVVMSQTTVLDSTRTTSQDTFVFYSNGTIGYPVTNSEVSVTGDGVLWPSAAGLASGRAFTSVVPIKVNNTGPAQDANVTVQGEGTHTVTVPAGTFQATLVVMTMSVRVSGFGSDEEVETWVAPGTGPVKSEVLLLAAGQAKVVTTEELLSFTKG